MKKSESIANLAMALCKFQGEVTNPKNTAPNPFFKSKYAPLSEVINTTKELMFNNGLSVLQSPSGDGEHIVITTLLMHSSGEWIEGEPLVLKADKITAQGAGSAITYGRRYALSAILGVASEEDDDGDHATRPDTKVDKQVTGGTANLEGFFAEALKIGYTKPQVLKMAGVISVDKWTRAKLGELYKDLETKSLSENIGGK